MTTHLETAAAIALICCTASCASRDSMGNYGVTAERYGAVKAPPMDPTRTVNDQDCSKPVVSDRGNLRCN